jgi:hypothetical protein
MVMNTHEDSMPFSFTPDGLDEATIDALINEENAQLSDVPSSVPVDFPERRPVRHRSAGKRTSGGRAA